jgi:catechol 2,3-dioxygenase-like lactoylglutathione lyase family enzyme
MLAALDHVTVLCTDLARSRLFYSDVLGLADGDRPNFDFPGAWLYLDGRPVLHLVGGRGGGGSTGSFDHVAFKATDITAMRARFQEYAIPFRERAVPGRPLRQLFVQDPDGVQVELNFHGE